MMGEEEFVKAVMRHMDRMKHMCPDGVKMTVIFRDTAPDGRLIQVSEDNLMQLLEKMNTMKPEFVGDLRDKTGSG